MPAYTRKLPNKNLWRVRDKEGHIYSYGTTKEKAERQVRLLNSRR